MSKKDISMGRHVTKARTATIAVAAIAALGLSSGLAYAYWSAQGTGTGAAAAGSSADLVVGAVASVGGLYPGLANKSGGSLNVTNPNPFPVTITGVSFGNANTTTSGCTGTSVTFAAGTPSATTVPADSTSVVAIPFTASMLTSAEDACQGATFTATLTVNGQSA